MRTPQQTRSTSSTDRMLDATLALLGRGGLQAVTVAAVASAAGASNGSLYHRFRDRTGLLVAAQDRALTVIEAATADAFRRADGEPDDLRAIGLLVQAALGIFEAHRPAMRAFLVEGQGLEEFEERNVRSSHLLATTVVEWLVSRFGTARSDAEATYRILFALGATNALFDDEQISPGALTGAALADAVTRALVAVVRP